jgi:hypothetical protein
MMCLARDRSDQFEGRLLGEEDYRLLPAVDRRCEGRVRGRSGRWGAVDLHGPRERSGRRVEPGALVVAVGAGGARPGQGLAGPGVDAGPGRRRLFGPCRGPWRACGLRSGGLRSDGIAHDCPPGGRGRQGLAGDRPCPGRRPPTGLVRGGAPCPGPWPGRGPPVGDRPGRDPGHGSQRRSTRPRRSRRGSGSSPPR